MRTILTIGSIAIASLPYLVEAMAAHPLGAVFLVILLLIAVFGVWVWRSSGQPARPPNRKRPTLK